jgi:hypothetical protein
VGLVQQKLRQSYWNYIENIIIEDSKLAESKPSKKLWSFIKVGFRFFNNVDVPSGVIMMSCILNL